MMKYTFTAVDDENDEFGPGREITHTIIGEQTWPQLVEHFERWLKGVGYIYDGELQIVDTK